MNLTPKALPLLLLALVLSGFFPPQSESGQYPLWEAAIGLVGFSFPDYRGSDQSRNYVLPFPYFIYRGDFFKVDRERVRGLFFRNPWLELDLSLGGSVPVDSSRNEARKGLPDLAPVAEIGPSLELIFGEKKGAYRTTVTLPFRFAGAIPFPEVYSIGWVFTPRLNVDKYNIGGWSGFNLGMSFGPVFGSADYHDYFYSVQPAQATPSRPAYSAQGGYGGTQLSVGLSKYFKRFWVSLFARWDQLDGAVFADSPLYRKNTSLITGLAFTWIFAESAVMVEADK
ncbi:MAG: MipA/OmpV family protein [Deltaproteobacteria bacterium]|nr:MipA/OmpV family protein [Deltaproteobacteria bacterium]